MNAKSSEPGNHTPPRLGRFLGYQLECQHAVAEVLDLGFMAVIGKRADQSFCCRLKERTIARRRFEQTGFREILVCGPTNEIEYPVYRSGLCVHSAKTMKVFGGFGGAVHVGFRAVRGHRRL